MSFTLALERSSATPVDLVVSAPVLRAALPPRGHRCPVRSSLSFDPQTGRLELNSVEVWTVQTPSPPRLEETWIGEPLIIGQALRRSLLPEVSVVYIECDANNVKVTGQGAYCAYREIISLPETAWAHDAFCVRFPAHAIRALTRSSSPRANLTLHGDQCASLQVGSLPLTAKTTSWGQRGNPPRWSRLLPKDAVRAVFDRRIREIRTHNRHLGFRPNAGCLCLCELEDATIWIQAELLQTVLPVFEDGELEAQYDPNDPCAPLLLGKEHQQAMLAGIRPEYRHSGPKPG
jgi:hypothetical protein